MSLSSSALSLLALSFAVSFHPVPAHAADGVPDPDFGDGGGGAAFIRPDDVEARQLHPYATSILPNGQILLGGFRSQHNPEVPFEPVLRAMVARLNADGSVDTAFGTQGFTRLAYTDISALAIDTRGRVVVAGNNREDFGHMFGTVTRLTPNGAIDTSFADAGTRAIDWDGGVNGNALDALAIGADDAIVVGGSYDTGEGPDSDFAIARFTADGDYDTTFAGTGRRRFKAADVVSPVNHIERLALAPGGAIAFAGQYTNTGGKRALVISRLDAHGATDTAFGDPASPGYLRPAIVPDAFGVDTTGFLVQPDGKLVASVTYYSPTLKKEFLAVRTTAAGTLDATFADGGLFALDLAPQGPSSETGSMALQADGRLVVAGAAEREEPLIDLAVVRLRNPSIAPDMIFADGFDR